MAPHQPKQTCERVDEHRRCLRQRGLRPIQIWAPDGPSPSFTSEAHRQSLAVAASAHERVDQAFIDAISELDVEDGGNG